MDPAIWKKNVHLGGSLVYWPSLRSESATSFLKKSNSDQCSLTLEHIQGLKRGTVAIQVCIHGRTAYKSATHTQVFYNTYMGFPGCINAASNWIAYLTDMLKPVVAVTSNWSTSRIVNKGEARTEPKEHCQKHTYRSEQNDWPPGDKIFSKISRPTLEWTHQGINGTLVVYWNNPL